MKTRIAYAACWTLVLLPAVGYGDVWNLADDYSSVQNPNGTWSYGWRENPGQPLVLYVDHAFPCSGFDSWTYYVELWCPRLFRNPSGYPMGCETYVLGPDEVAIHPGPAQQSVVRWTAPRSMTVALTVRYEALDIGSSIVHVYRDGTPLFSATLDSFGEVADFSATIVCEAGDVIDCAIDPISFYYDSTQLDVVLTSDEPPVGACCFPSGACLQGTAAACESAGGSYVGDGIPCEPNPCGGVEVDHATWGSVKSLYR